MASVVLNSVTYTDDANASTGMANGGHRVRFVPCLANFVAEAATQLALQHASRDAADASEAAALASELAAAASALSALNSPGTNATSVTSITFGTGSKTLTIQTGKDLVVGQFVSIAYTPDATRWMQGVITSYDSGTGSLTVMVDEFSGSGTFAAWSIALVGRSGTGKIAYVAQTADYTVQASDGGHWIACTGTFTLSVPAVSTLGSSWSLYVKNGGDGVITIAASGAELVDGDSSLPLYPGDTRLMVAKAGGLTTSKVGGGIPLFSALLLNDSATNVACDGAMYQKVGTFALYDTANHLPYQYLPSDHISYWQNQVSGTLTDNFTGVVFGGGTYLTGTTSTLRYSSDGITWTSATSNPANGAPCSYVNGQFVATQTSTGNKVGLSLDGDTWTSYTLSTTLVGGYGDGAHVVNGNVINPGYSVFKPSPGVMPKALLLSAGITTPAARAVASSGNTVVFLSSGTAGRAAKSTDGGFTWVENTTIAGVNAQKCLVHAGSYYIGGIAEVTTDKPIITSTDAVTWTEQTINFGATNERCDVLITDGTTVAAVGAGPTLPVVFTATTPFSTWSAATSQPTLGTEALCGCYGNGKWLVLSAGHYHVATNPGGLWTSTPQHFDAPPVFAMYDPDTSLFVVLCQVWLEFYIYTLPSTAAGAWTVRGQYPGTPKTLFRYNATTYAVGISAIEGWSSNNTTWTTTAVTNKATGVQRAYAYSTTNGATVGATSVGATLGLPYLTQHMLDGDFYDVVYGSADNIFVMVGAAGSVFTSPDGTTWTSRTSGVVSNITGVAEMSGVFVAVSSTTALVSADGISWAAYSLPKAATKITAGGGLFTAVGQGYISTSPDGITWTLRSPSFNGATALAGVAYGGVSGAEIVAVGNNGAILTSSQTYSGAPVGVMAGGAGVIAPSAIGGKFNTYQRLK